MTVFLVIAAAIWGMATMAMFMHNTCPYDCKYCSEQKNKRQQEPPSRYNFRP